MKTIEINLYSFEELSKEVQERVLTVHRNINVEHQWWDSTYEDAKNIGLEITESDWSYRAHAKGIFIIDAIEVAEKIFENHGKECETYKIADRFKELYYKPDADIETLEERFLSDLLNEYGIMLQNESEYLTSDEAIIETIKANEYTFEENGTMRNI